MDLGLSRAAWWRSSARERNRRGDRARRSRPERPRDRGHRSATLASSILRQHEFPPSIDSGLVRGDVCDLVASVTIGSPYAAEEIARRLGRCDHVVLRRRRRLGQIRLSVLEARAVRLGTRAQGQPDRRGERGARVRPGDGSRLAAQREWPAPGSSPSLLFLSSVAGQIGSQTDPPYSAAKAAVINFAQCAAKDLAPFGVRVNTLCPGMVQTPLNRGVYEAWAREQPESERSSYEAWTAEKIKKVVPLNRWQQPEDIAAMAVFLASSRARNITGQTINVDGGFVMHW